MNFITTDSVEVILFEKTNWLNEWNIKEQLYNSNISAIITNHPEYLKKERQELQDCGKYQPSRKFVREDLGIHVIMDCRTVAAVEFRKRLGFNQHDSIMTQEQSVLTKLDTYFKTEDKIFQHYVLGYRIDMYVPKCKLTIEVDELGHCTRDKR